MSHAESYSPSVMIRVVYEDLPDLIEIETRVEIRAWRAIANSYTSPINLANNARNLAAWSLQPVGEFSFESGADTGIGWLLLRFYSIDKSGHLVCHVTL